MDVGDRTTHYCLLRDREVVGRGHFPTTGKGLDRALQAHAGSRVILEAGSQSPWMSRHLLGLGFVVHVADPRRVQLIAKDPRKTDRRDAELLARLEHGMPELLGRVHHRSEQAQADLAMIRARDQVVRARASLVQCVRGLTKSFGLRLPSASTKGFGKKVRGLVPQILLPAVEPLLDQIVALSATIRTYDRCIGKAAEERYPEAAVLQQVHGVGPLTSMAFALTIEEPTRFDDSRRVGSWVGLCPRSQASGDKAPELGISKSGDGYLRRLLVQCAQYILGPFGKDGDLRRFGLRLAARGGRSAKKRAVTAVARKLAVLLHRLWRHGLSYDPLHDADRKAARLSA
ncbi:MAG: IS110 family transposase [Planctomycetota bacterium]